MGRSTTIGAVVLAVAFIATVPIVLSRPDAARPATPEAASSSPPSLTRPAPVQTSSLPLADPTIATYSFTVGPVSGATPIYRETGVGFQRVFLGGPSYPVVTVYPPGGWAPHRPAGAVGVTVGARAGFYGQIAHTGPDAPAITARDPMLIGNSLVWQYLPAAWARIDVTAQGTGLGLSPRQLLAVASAVRFGVHTTVTVPSQLRYIPAGDHVTNILVDEGARGPHTTVSLAKIGSSITITEISIGAPSARMDPGMRPVDPNLVHETIGRFTGTYSRGWLAVNDAVTEIDISGAGDTSQGVPSEAGAVEMLRGLTMAARPNDLSTWFAVTNTNH
jgi:hypothetical protein